MVSAAINGRSELILCCQHRNLFSWGFSSGIKAPKKNIVASDTVPRGTNAIFDMINQGKLQL